MNIETALDQVSFYKKKFPAEAVNFIASNRDLFEDKFLEILDAYSKDSKLYEQQKDDYFSAILFLGQFQTKKAFPVILDLLKTLPYSYEEDQPLGDFITEVIPYVLAACFDGNLYATREVLYSEDAYLFSKLAVQSMLEICLYLNILTEEEVLKFLEEIIETLHAQNNDDEAVQFFISGLADISFEKAEEISSKYGIILKEETLLEIEYLKKPTTPKPFYLSLKDKTLASYHQIISEGMNILQEWQMFKEEEENHSHACDHDHGFCGHALSHPLKKRHDIGRNDPCYCGSGKKFKKCCL